MKRQLSDIDNLLPARVLQTHEGAAGILSHVNESFAKIETLLLKKKRVDLAVNSEPQVKQKVLRVYIRHEYIAAPANDRAHFIIHIEGLLLDHSISTTTHLGAFFERVSVQTQSERKNNQNSQILEWKEEDYALGSSADSFRAKIYSEKPCLCKILLHRSNEVITRYNISDQLRTVIPYLRFDPTEEEVLVAMWQYIDVNGLFAPDKDKRYFKLNDALKEVLLGDRNSIMTVMMISALRSKVLPHIIQVRPVAVDHYLNVTNTPEVFAQSLKANYSLSGGGRWPTAILYARTGGRVFEMDVDMRDPACYHTLAALNMCTALEFDSNDLVSTQMEKLAYLAKQMRSLHQERVALTQALTVLDQSCGDGVLQALGGADAVGTDEEEEIAESALQRQLRDACLTPLYERIRQRPATPRYNTPAHSAHALEMRAAAHNITANTTTNEAKLKTEASNGKPAAAGGGKTHTEAPSLQYSSLHSLSGYIDVGDTALFQGSWVKPATEKLVQDPTAVKFMKAEHS